MSENEPLLTVGSITAVVTAAIALLVSFGLPISDGQQTAMLRILAVVVPLVVAFIARRKVFSPTTVKKLLGSDASTNAEPPAQA